MYRYVYCITKTLCDLPKGISGIGDTSIFTLQYQDITAILSKTPVAKLPISNDNVSCHAAVVEAIHQKQTALPLRFSSIFQDDEEVLRFLKNRSTIFTADLERLHDKFEIGLRVLLNGKNLKNACTPQPPNYWRITKNNKEDTVWLWEYRRNDRDRSVAYLEQQRTYYKSLDEGKDCIDEIISTCRVQFEGIYTECKRGTTFSSLQGISLNYLVCRNFLSEFRKRFRDLMTSLTEFHFLYSGPWPPYHFVSSGSAGGNKVDIQ